MHAWFWRYSLVGLLALVFPLTAWAESPKIFIPTIANIRVEQLHATTKERPHRYRLTLEGKNLEGTTAEWRIDCGEIIGAKNTASVEWRYDPPGACASAKVGLLLRNQHGGQRRVQSVFDPRDQKTTSFTTPTPEERGTKTPEEARQRGRIEPTGVAVTPLPPDPQTGWSRYQLRVEGENLDGQTVSFRWTAGCGKFLTGGQGPDPRYGGLGARAVVWGYDPADTQCAQGKFRVSIRDLHGDDYVAFSQIRLDRQAEPEKLEYRPGEVSPRPFTLRQKLRLYIGHWWYLLKYGWRNPKDIPREEPGFGGVRG